MKKNNITVSQINMHHSTIAILQTTRFGDLIQTAQAISDLKIQYPHYRIVLIARNQFAKPLEFIFTKLVDKIYYLDTKTIFQDSETKGLTPTLHSLNQFLFQISEETIDVLINLSFSKSSAYLASLISASNKTGSFIDRNNRMCINDKWSQMLFATVMRGNLNPFSLVDLFRNIIGIKPEPRASITQAFNIKKKNIVIHPFASQERKAWRSEKWVEVIYKTLKDHESISITIVGAKNELLKSQQLLDNPLLKSFSTRIINLTGKTSIEQLSTEVKNARLFIGHDSMVGHLSALMNTTSLTISLGSVRPQETTPYQSNSYNLSPKTKCFPCFASDQCENFQCHHDIPHQAISSAIKLLLEKSVITPVDVKNGISSFHLSSINFYRSKFSNDQMVLENLIDGNLDTPEVFRNLYRVTWSFMLSDIELSSPFPRLSQNTHREMLTTLAGLQHLFELSDFGKRYSRYILEEISSATPSIIKIKDFSKKIDEIDQLQTMVQKTSPYLSPFIDYFIVRKANLNGDNIVSLAENSYHAFEECGNLSKILYELIENAIAEFKIANPRNELNK
jgi:ADP-heptose:LPS heptosyltransferase